MYDTEQSVRHLVLLVDDDATTLKVLARALQADYDVLVATDGQTALRIAAGQPAPDVILLDVMMPEMDGYAVCRQLKQSPQTRHIPVIFVTSHNAPDAEEFGLSLGAVDYVTKPYTPSVVRARVRTQLNLRVLISELEGVNRTLNDKLTQLQQQHEMLVWYSSELVEAKSRHRLLAQVFESTNDGVLITSKSGEIMAVNAAFTSICGYSEAEVLGRNPRLLKSGRHDSHFFEMMWERIHRTGSWTGEVWNRRKNNEIFAELLTISTVLDEGGEVSCYIGVFSDVSRLKEVQDRMDFLTWHDASTGLPNRQLFSDRLVQTLGNAVPSLQKGVVMVFDIDNFSDLNASRGMEAGDQALSQIARQLSQELDHGASMARLGGAQFAVLMPRVFADADAAAGQAGYFAQRIRQVLQASSQEMEGDLFHLRATVGVAIYPENPFEVAGEIVRRAETARRKGKASGGDTVMFFEASMGELIESRLKGEHALRAAIANQELAVFLQSQVDFKGRILGAEALVRWNHPERGLLAPGAFIAQAETSNLIVELDRWMLDQVCALIAFLDSQHVAVPISVNISPRHFREPDFVEHILATLERHRVPPRQLVLEVTEGMMLEDLAQVIERMTSLNRHGVYFSLDDFGTGYSSLAYLKQLPLWELKIDQSFTQGVDVNPNDASLVEVILDIALRFNLHVVAEGVETDAQANFLRQRGVPSMQGYLFSRPKNLVSWLAHFGLTRP